MNPDDQTTTDANAEPAPAGINIDDILFTLFRHKYLILGFACLGLVAAIAVRFVKPPLYVSSAQVMVRYVAERSPTPAEAESHIIAPESGGQSITRSEVIILKTLDVATNVAMKIGPERILAHKREKTLMGAAWAIMNGVDVEVPPGTSILKIYFKHLDPSLVQPVLQAVIDAYMNKHNEVHGLNGELDEYYAKQRDELRDKLGKTEEELKRILKNANVLSVEETKHALQAQTAKWQDELHTAEVALALHKALFNDTAQAAIASASTNDSASSLPNAKIEEYTDLMRNLDVFKQREREYVIDKRFASEHPLLLNVRGEIGKLVEQRAKMLASYPSLVNLSVATTRGTNTAETSLAELRSLTAKVQTVATILSNVQADASRLLELEPKILDLERQRDQQATNYLHFAKSLDMTRVRAALGEGKLINMSVLEKPTPPSLDRKKFLKMLAGAFGGCVACGLGLAFLIDFLIDRSIKRSKDIERHLNLPVFISIPDTSWSNRLRLPWANGSSEKSNLPVLAATNGNGHPEGEHSEDHPEEVHDLQQYAEGLRERLMTWFEVKNMNLKKPKLVGVTGCAAGAGVTTLASGLAAALSKTGDGNVLLVDMNAQQGAARSFHNGKSGCGLLDVLEPAGMADAQIQENLYVASMRDNVGNKLVKAQPNGLNHLMPKIQASDYDYIIFDMPPVSQTSTTPRLAGHMDIVLLVLESEKTGQQAAARATALMRDSKANVATVLNKCRQHVPARLSQEL